MLRRYVAAGAALLCWAGTAHAQEAPLEEIIVTGSLIKGSAADAPSPVQTISREDLVQSGVSDVSEFIRNLEIASGSDTAPQDGGRFNGSSGSGLANINLRGVGPTATLVLLDGKRLPFAGQKLGDGDRFVDINTIPITMLERVEVLKDGGSAIYGSDAIAGVVNFITRDEFEGFEFTAKHQETDAGGQTDTTLGALFGWTSGNEKTHFVIGGEYFDRDELRESERPDLRRDVFPLQNASIVNAASLAQPGIPDANCAGALGESLGFFPNNAFGSAPNQCSRDGTLTDVLIPDQRRSSLMATFKHTFSDSVEFYSQLSWYDAQSGSRDAVFNGPIAPKFSLPGLFAGFTAATGLGTQAPAFLPVPGFNDPALSFNGGTVDLAAGGAVELVDFTARVPGVDADREFREGNDTESTRLQFGLRGDFQISDRPWSYDVSYTRGESEFSTQFLGLDASNVDLALFGLGGPNCVPDGEVNDPTARFFLAGGDGVIDATAGAPGAVGPFEGIIDALLGDVSGQPFINPDVLAVALTSTNRGDNSQGCFFFNPFVSRAGDNPAFQNSEELIQFLEFPNRNAQRSETELTTVDFVVSGDLFDLPAGPAAVAFGLQYRKEGRETVVNPITFGELNSFGELQGNESVAGLSENQNFDADREIFAAFLEFQLPLHEKLDVQLAARFEDNPGNIGSTFDPKLGLRFQATDSLVLRTSVSSSFRAPGLAQIEEGNGFSLEFGVPDRIGQQPNPAGANCVRTGRCPIPDTADAPTIIAVTSGEPSPNLEPEQAITFNFGAIYEPGGRAEGLRVGVDYWRIDFEDKIINVPSQALLNEEFALFETALAAGDFTVVVPGAPGFGQPCDPLDPMFDPGPASGQLSEACQVDPAAFALTPANSQFDGGQITRRADATRSLQIFNSTSVNSGNIEVDGIDLDLQYRWDNRAGSFIASSAISWIREFEVTNFPGGIDDFDAAGFSNANPNARLAQALPDLRGNVGLSWLRNRHSARVNMRFVGSFEDNAVVTIDDGQLDDYFAFDLTYNYAFSVPGGDDSSVLLTVGAIDLFDASLPEVFDDRGTLISIYDSRGRRFFGSLRYSF